MKKKWIGRIIWIAALVLFTLVLVLHRFHFVMEKRSSAGAYIPGLSSPEALSSVIYEGIFFDPEEAENLFREFREQPVFDKITDNPHMTAIFFPIEDHREFYGEPVRVHVTGYRWETFLDKNGRPAGAEASCVKPESDNPALQAYFDSLPVIWHITRSYTAEAGHAAKLNYDEAVPCDLYLSGTFGGYCAPDLTCYDSACPDTGVLRNPVEEP